MTSTYVLTKCLSVKLSKNVFMPFCILGRSAFYHSHILLLLAHKKSCFFEEESFLTVDSNFISLTNIATKMAVPINLSTVINNTAFFCLSLYIHNNRRLTITCYCLDEQPFGYGPVHRGSQLLAFIGS